MVRADLAVGAAGKVEPPPPPEKYDLTVSSIAGGSVTEPGEGTFNYEEETVVDLVADADSGYVFVEWTGDTGTITDVNTASTTITMDDDYSITATFAEAEENDLSEPEIITFKFAPRTTGPWNRVDVEWDVYHKDGALDKVKSELLVLDNEGEVVEVLDMETTSVSGESASGEHHLRTRGDADAVRLTVIDTGGGETSKTKNLE